MRAKGQGNFPQRVRLVEVGPRDGLQNEKEIIETEVKANFIEKLFLAGHGAVEVTSFVRSEKIPQMGDGEKLFSLVKKFLEEKRQLICLVPNMKGFERARDLGVRDIAVFTATSDTFNEKNTNIKVSQSLERIAPVVEKALSLGMRVRGYISTAFGCPYEGAMKAQRSGEVASELDKMGCCEISLGDTIGSATPYGVHRVLDEVLKGVELSKIALHFHDTRGMALANILAGLERGVWQYDASAGGLGGCPYAKGATGNVATEDLVYFFNAMGIDCGVSLDPLCEASSFILGKLKKKTTSKFLQLYFSHLKKGGERNHPIYLPTPGDYR